MYGPELQQGSTIAGRYRLKQYKGSGSFGEVWLAEDLELGLDVAIKLYISLDQKGQEEFKDEYKIAYGLSHENLLTAQYYSVWDHRPYLIMKYCSQGSAANLGGNASEAQIWRFIHDVANGLKYLHALEPPIVHQDIKPENILIDDQGNFLITDFGISKKMRTTMRKQSKRQIESGAIAYMGPERFLKDPMAVKASDIWSLGVSIYELATNDLPFMGQGGGMLNAGAALPELDQSKWSKNLSDVMQACLAKETWDRPTAEDLVDYTQQLMRGKNLTWEQWKRGEQDMPQKTDPVEAKPKKTSWILPAVIGAAVVGVLLFFIFKNDKEAEHQMMAVEQRYQSIASMCENNIRVGDAQNYTALLEAKSLIDSLKEYEYQYSYLTENKSFNLETSLDAKLEEAQKAWIRSAQGQYDVAEDVASAIQYYHIAALLQDNSTIKQALANIASRDNCKGAYMLVTNVTIDGSYLIINYDGLNSQSQDFTLKYELSGSGSPKTGQSSITLRPGSGQSVRIDTSMSGLSGMNQIKLSSNNIVFYNQKIGR